MKVATWNVNSINQRHCHLKALLKEEKIDIIMLQETKCTDDNFPHAELQSLGYHIIFKGQTAYNGVAILSKYSIQNLDFWLMNDDQPRYIEGIVEHNGGRFILINIYAPHRQSPELPRFEYKMQFYNKLKARVQDLLANDEVLLIGGDYNVAPENIDVHDHKKLEGSMGFHIQERQQLKELLNIGFFDAFQLKHPETQEFSWWDYRSFGFQYNRGMRIDHIHASAEGIDILQDCYMKKKKTRGLERPSDHVPVVCILGVC